MSNDFILEEREIMNYEIKNIPLIDICEEVVDCPHSTPKWTNEGVIVLRNSNIKNGRLDLSNPSFTDELHYEDRSRRAKLLAGDLVITREAPMGEVCQIPENLKCCLGQRMVLLRPSKYKCDGKYLLYALQSRKVQHEINSYDGTGSTVSNLRIPVLKNLSIPTPSLSIQKNIANILGTLDEKIELNKKNSETLEQIVQTHFKSWFIDFDPVKTKSEGRSTGLPDEISNLFPNLFEQSELGQIPKGWKIDILSNHLSLTKGKSYKSFELQGSKNALVTLKSFQRGGGYREEGLKPYSGEYKKEQIILPGELIIALTDVTQAADVIGRPAIVESNNLFDNLIASLDVGIIRTKKTGLITKEYSMQLLKTPKYISHALSYTSGTTVLHLSKKLFETFCFVMPEERLIKFFTSFYNEILQKIDLNQIYSNNLIKVRDNLLPKLISGEIRIPDAEKFLEKVGI